MKQFLQNTLLFWLGFLVLILNKIRHTVRGYTDPRGFPASEVDRAIAYDKKVLSQWLRYLKEYSGSDSLKGKTVLELGPGADLGIAVMAIAHGAKKYYALDKHPLALSAPQEFYEGLQISSPPARGGVESPRAEGVGIPASPSLCHSRTSSCHSRTSSCHSRESGNPVPSLSSSFPFLPCQRGGVPSSGRRGGSAELHETTPIHYLHNPAFDPKDIPDNTIDIIFSQAAFEHFDDVPKLFKQLSSKVKSGTVLIAEVDLKTHTRFIRDRDPLNIYRYPDPLYNTLKFSGSPNRLRPFEYKQILEDTGWENIQIIPLKTLPDSALQKTLPSLNKKFLPKKNEMAILECILCAKKK